MRDSIRITLHHSSLTPEVISEDNGELPILIRGINSIDIEQLQSILSVVKVTFMIVLVLKHCSLCGRYIIRMRRFT